MIKRVLFLLIMCIFAVSVIGCSSIENDAINNTVNNPTDQTSSDDFVFVLEKDPVVPIKKRLYGNDASILIELLKHSEPLKQIPDTFDPDYIIQINSEKYEYDSTSGIVFFINSSEYTKSEDADNINAICQKHLDHVYNG